MENSQIEVTVNSLFELKNNLNNLSDTLHGIYEMMNTEMNRLGETWRDYKFMEFVEGYQPQIKKCEDISVRYKEWCTKVIEPRIEKTISINDFNLNGH